MKLINAILMGLILIVFALTLLIMRSCMAYDNDRYIGQLEDRVAVLESTMQTFFPEAERELARSK